MKFKVLFFLFCCLTLRSEAQDVTTNTPPLVLDPTQCGAAQQAFSNYGGYLDEVLLYPVESMMYFQSDPCIALLSDANENAKYTSVGIDLNKALGPSSTCWARCVNYVEMRSMPVCGPRRVAMDWSLSAPTSDQVVNRINCSNLNLPLPSNLLNSAEIVMLLTIEEPPPDQDNSLYDGYFQYLSQLNISTLMFQYGGNANQVNSTSFFMRTLNAVAPTLRNLEYTPFGTLTAELAIPIFASVLNLDTFSVVGGNFNDMPPLRSDITKFKSIGLESVTFNSGQLPSWFSQASGMEFIYFNGINGAGGNTLILNTTALNSFPNLKIFDVTGVIISSINGTFLAASKNLIVLDLFCTGITYIQPGALDHLVNLLILNLAANSIQTLDPAVTGNLASIQYFDVRIPPLVFGMPGTYLYQMPELEYVSEFCGLPYPAVPISYLSQQHLKSATNLKRLELGGLNYTSIDSGVFKNKSQLAWLNMEFMNLKDLNILEGASTCNLMGLQVVGNDLSQSNWLPQSVLGSLVNLRYMIITDTNISTVTGSMYLLSQKSTTLEDFITAELLNDNPVSNDICQQAIWISLTNQFQSPYLSSNPTCMSKYLAVQQNVQSLLSANNQQYCSGAVNNFAFNLLILLGLAVILR